MSHKNPITIVGETTDGKLVVAGVYAFYETFGLPLEVLIDYLYYKKNQLPCWKTLIEDMVKAGMDKQRAIRRLCAALEDAFLNNPEIRREVVSRLKTL